MDLGRHYTELAKQTHGVNDGFYPLGSCTMKYNPRINEEMAALPGLYRRLHPLQPVETVQGCAGGAAATAERLLCEITGMDAHDLPARRRRPRGVHRPAAHQGLSPDRGDTARTKILVPDSAHGTNPASASHGGLPGGATFPPDQTGCVDLDGPARQAVGPDTAGLMLTNPNTVGIV